MIAMMDKIKAVLSNKKVLAAAAALALAILEALGVTGFRAFLGL